jgi:hypothetical protein
MLYSMHVYMGIYIVYIEKVEAWALISESHS